MTKNVEVIFSGIKLAVIYAPLKQETYYKILLDLVFIFIVTWYFFALISL